MAIAATKESDKDNHDNRADYQQADAANSEPPDPLRVVQIVVPVPRIVAHFAEQYKSFALLSVK